MKLSKLICKCMVLVEENAVMIEIYFFLLKYHSSIFGYWNELLFFNVKKRDCTVKEPDITFCGEVVQLFEVCVRVIQSRI